MMNSETLEALDLAGNGVRVVFEWRDDRFSHAIYGMQRGEPILLTASIEGDAVNPWPPSPPLQQLHKQQNESGEVLFLTGMAGSSHWSGSVSANVGERGPEVTFDFACRHRTVPEWLGVTYHLADGVESAVIGDRAKMKIGESLEWRIVAKDISVCDGELRLVAQSNAQEAAGNTTRWEYLMCLASLD